MKLIWCPPGKFKMGSPESSKDADPNEKPQVEVTLTGFWLGQTEVTQAQWTTVMGTTPWQREQNPKEGPLYPASCVTWHDAIGFCRKLTDLERTAGRLPKGWRYSLPTEAQWEYACRATTTTAYSCGDDPTLLGDYAWWRGFNDDGTTSAEAYAHRVELKKPNAWGLYDMHGNVWEWCRDWFGGKLAAGADPTGPAKGVYRVIRGGAWFPRFPGDCRSACRAGDDPSNSDVDCGFRVALVHYAE
jgi:formylglycine-generating enzyme required for sulfatase activity